METKKKKRILNILMIVMILIIAGSGVLAVGSLKGWFGGKKQTQIYCDSVVGIANIERCGVGYSLKKDTALAEQDLIETRQGSSAKLRIREDQELVMNQNSELKILTASDREIILKLNKGEILADTAQISSGMKVSFEGIKEFDEIEAEAQSAVFSLSVQSGSAQVNVFKGAVSVSAGTDTKQTVREKESLLIVNGNMTKGELHPEELNEFLIQQLQNCKNANQIVFSSEELQKIVDDREAQKQAALEESLNSGIYVSAKENNETNESKADENKTDAHPTKTPANSEKQSDGSVTVETEQSVEDSDDADTNNEEAEDVQDDADNENTSIRTCTIQIVCDTILDNLDNLSDGKEAYVPANGVILATSTVEFNDGETVFDVLNRVCSAAGIHLEYSWTPMYNSYYIEGINNLYEFDCGNESGWMYKVNGWFPNYGCSSYTLEDGDSIVWCYTCNGLGADVGGGM